MTRAVLALTVLVLTGCVNPNAIGVQQYGTIAGHIYNLKSQPINGALVSVSSLCATYSAPDGSYTLTQGPGCAGGVPIGIQTLTVTANGYTAPPQQVSVTQGQVSIVQVQMTPVGN